MSNKSLKKRSKCKHKNIRRFRTYELGDFYFYHKKCINCKKEVGGWTVDEAEKQEIK
jgi:hypothetical protein